MGGLRNLSEEQVMSMQHVASPFLWITDNKLQLATGPYSIKEHEYQLDWLECNAPKQCFIKGAQIGAYLSCDQIVPTPTGWTKMGSIDRGDVVFDECGSPVLVTHAFQVERDLPCYRVYLSDGTTIITDRTHRWRVRHVKYNTYKTLTTEQILKKVKYRRGTRARYAIDVAEAIQTPVCKLDIDPYILGLFLGDGSRSSGYITGEYQDIGEYARYAKSIGWEYQLKHSKKEDYIFELKFIPPDGETFHHKKRHFIDQKYIPKQYLRSSFGQRLSLLQGLIDSDGHIDKGGSCFFYNSEIRLIHDVCELVNSLGLKAKINFRGWNENGFNGEPRQSKPTPKWEVYFKADKSLQVASLKRKYDRQVTIRRTKETNSRYIIDVRPAASVPVRCISVANKSNLFLIGRNFVPTHNSEINVLKTLHGMVHGRYNQGALYLFPTRDDVGDFSKARFDPLIEQNPFIGAYVHNTNDSKNIKRIGQGHLYLRGARATKTVGGTKKSSSQLKSISVDRVVFDEFDEMEESMIELARYRISHSKIGELIYLGTPTIPDYGMDKLYQTSDQRVWMVECPSCGKEASLDLEFPASIRRRLDGTAYRACVYCQAEVHPGKGRWVAMYPSRSDDLVGWWISQLNSLYVDPTHILDKYEDPPFGNLGEVMNSILGRAYIPAENRLTHAEVYSCCGNDAMALKHEGPCCMGVDVGAKLHVVIAQRLSRKTLKVLKIGRFDNFYDLHDLARDFNVKSTVIDLFPEKRKVVEFQKSENHSVFGCNYVETRTGQIAWDEKDHIIKGNRTEICDMTHELVSSPGGLVLPRRCQEVDEFVKEVCNIAKVLDEDPTTGAKIFRYKKLSVNDHYRHALNYTLLASERVGTVSDSKLIGRFFHGRKRRTWLTS